MQLNVFRLCCILYLVKKTKTRKLTEPSHVFSQPVDYKKDNMINNSTADLIRFSYLSVTLLLRLQFHKYKVSDVFAWLEKLCGLGDKFLKSSALQCQDVMFLS